MKPKDEPRKIYLNTEFNSIAVYSALIVNKLALVTALFLGSVVVSYMESYRLDVLLRTKHVDKVHLVLLLSSETSFQLLFIILTYY